MIKPNLIDPELADNLEVEESSPRISARLSQFKKRTLEAVERRERVPQTLFWSLFRTELRELKLLRARKRVELQKLFGCEWL